MVMTIPLRISVAFSNMIVCVSPRVVSEVQVNPGVVTCCPAKKILRDARAGALLIRSEKESLTARGSLLSGGGTSPRGLHPHPCGMSPWPPWAPPKQRFIRPLAAKRARPEAWRSLKEMYWPGPVLTRSLSEYCLSKARFKESGGQWAGTFMSCSHRRISVSRRSGSVGDGKPAYHAKHFGPCFLERDKSIGGLRSNLDVIACCCPAPN